MSEFAVIGMVVAMLGVLAMLGAGLYTMLRGGDVTGVRSNKLMWMRVLFQGVALAFFALVLVMAKK